MRTPLSIEEIHSITLNLVSKIAEICESNTIDYFVTYGSLIGAIRHKGFIPWDDDFDIAMLRHNFDRFCDYCYSHEKELYPYKLLDRSTTEGYPFNIPRFCDLRYSLESTLDPQSVQMGVFVDVYPFDGLGNDPLVITKKLNWRMRIYMSAIDYQRRGHYTPSKTSLSYSIIRYFVYLWSKIKPREFFLDKMMKLRTRFSKEVSESEYVGCVVWDAGIKPKKKEWCIKTIDAPFENITVKIPIQYDLYLKSSYGNYMELPPVEQRVATHDYSIYRIEIND